MKTTRKALLLGATGLVGGHVLHRLVGEEAYTEVVTLGRRPMAAAGDKHQHQVVDFSALQARAALFEVDDVFCCLGTTMKRAGSKEAFRRVDHDYPVAAAQLAARQGARRYLMVSALGADPGSLFFYNRVKGEAEAAVAAQPLNGVYLFQPSLLTGDRTEQRRGEQVGEQVLKRLAFLLRGPLRKYRPISARTVAEAMVTMALQAPGGVRRIPSDEIAAITAGA